MEALDLDDVLLVLRTSWQAVNEQAGGDQAKVLAEVNKVADPMIETINKTNAEHPELIAAHLALAAWNVLAVVVLTIMEDAEAGKPLSEKLGGKNGKKFDVN